MRAIAASLAAVALSCGGGTTTEPPLVPSRVSVPCAGAPRTEEACIPGGDSLAGHAPLDPPPAPPCQNPPCGPGPGRYDLAAPEHLVWLSPFFIDRYPATNAEYLECFAAGACPDECQVVGCAGGLYDEVHLADPALAGYPMTTLLGRAAAEAYCRSRGKRLPTEAEWERAARGPDSTDYPWGDGPADCARVPCGTPGDPAARGGPPSPLKWHYPVGGNAGDVSPEGVRELVTGVPEVVADDLYEYPHELGPLVDPRGTSASPQPAVRGADSDSEYRYGGVAFPVPAWWRGTGPGGLGVRCARSDVPGGADDPTSALDVCAGGACLAAPQARPRVLAVAATGVAWVNGYAPNGVLMTQSLLSGDRRMLAAGGVSDSGVEMDATHVYAFVAGALARVPRAGGAATPLGIAPPFCGFALDVTDLYVGGPTLRRVAKTGGAETVLATAAGSDDYCVAALGPGLVYAWLGLQLVAVPKAGGGEVVIGAGAGEVVIGAGAGATVVADATDVFFIARDAAGLPDRIQRAPAAGGPVSTFAAAAFPVGLALDGANLFFSESATGLVWAAPRAGGAPTVIGAGSYPRRLRAQGGFLYWVDAGTPQGYDGAVSRVPW